MTNRTPGASPLSLLRQQAIAHYRAERREEALATVRQLLALAPKDAEVLAFAGSVAGELGRGEEAVAYYEAAVAARRDFAEAHYNLGLALMRLERPEKAVEAYRRAARLRPELMPIHNNLGIALQALGRWDEAAAAYRRAAALDAGNAEVRRNLGIALWSAKKIDDAVAALREAIALQPGVSKAHSSLANLLLEERAPADVVAACDAWLARCPGTIEAIGLKSVALALLGDREGAEHLVDLDRFVRVIRFEAPPPGFASMRDFNAALTRHALEHPTLRLPPESDPHYHCPTLRITGEFLAEPKGPAAALETIMRQAVSEYLADLARGDRMHAYAAAPPQRWRLISWAAVLDRQGNLLPHIHYDGYVSGVYYCRMPASIGAPDQGQAGWFELGRLPDHFAPPSPPKTRAIRPEEGLMILFPSYFYHRTVPFTAPEHRISIAFDANPVA